ncbi:hypothetical protein Ahu01nite_002360 [Winogradskya humida]|uniref:Secreted protein with PEP-CTERM sorting signal n=1 Tax=Winogradskya humida TaxID=113566 RepID=A0ABQ3ZEY3_9ACTN|nr:hypothetical protein Ahu01nite_002360 [Actinoplanes humidus]
MLAGEGVVRQQRVETADPDRYGFAAFAGGGVLLVRLMRRHVTLR